MPLLPADLLAGIPDASALRRLFAALGYSPQERTEYTARTLDWPANVAVDLRGRAFELLADADDGFFQVLLLPPHPETRGLSQELVRRLYTTLEQRGNEAILVLPDQGWGALELVLLADMRPIAQRGTPPSTFLRFSFDSRALRPHQQIALGLLDATGAGPGEPAERAARAFRRAQQERFFRSVNFFSTYYLERRIASDAPVQDRWAALSADMPALRAALDGAAAPAALAALGWQLAAPAAPGAPGRLAAAGAEVALLSILPADHPLDQALSDASYPQLELIAALEKQKQADGVRWAVLTNGRQWRLYSPIAASISGAFYEVDLGDLLAFGADDDLRYFAAFFGAAGLASGLARAVFTSSQTLAKEVGESLKKLVFDQVFALLASAIAEDLRRRGEYTGDDAQMELIRRATLVLLYRVLFLLYAESMRLLPTLHRDYYPHSLTFLLSEIAVHRFTPAHLQKPMGPTAFWAWEHLRELCAAVSGGRAAWGVPKYNGGLFSDGAAVNGQESPHRAPHRLLARAQLGAMDLCKALRLLGLDPAALAATTPEEARHLIDYAGLDVRRLGSIYEGLLEYRLAEAVGGELILRHSREDRKASGSYYTPDYIVAYIVEQAVGPVLDERASQFAALMERLPAARRELERATRAEGSERVSIATAQANSAAARKALAAIEHEAVESLLDLKILDPAMGSGHFLVEAVNFVTDRLIGILDRHKEGNPILARLDGIRQQIRASLRDQGIDAQLIGDAQLNNVNLLRRLVMKRCVFGVDLNDMAVELARLSLWLTSFTVGAPLNFLDHHLKWGNSLIGARVQAVQQAMEGKDVAGVGTQLDMFTSGSAFKEMLDLAGFIEELVEIADANAQQVEQSEQLYRAYEQSVVPVKRLLDLWVSRSFGSKEANELITIYSGGSEQIQQLKTALVGGKPLAHPPHQRALDRARELFEQHRFLHWDLDFPEVFLDLRQKAWKPADEMGFDAVVGNPPYVNVGRTDEYESEVNYYFAQFQTAEYQVDLYPLFMERAIHLLAVSCYVSYVAPNVWISNVRAKNIRKFVLENSSFIKWVHTDDVFIGVGVDVAVFVLRKNFNSENIIFVETFSEQGEQLLYSIPQQSIDITGASPMPLSRSIGASILVKVIHSSLLLHEVLEVNRGVGPYHHTKHTAEQIQNKIYHANYQKDSTFVPELRGEDVQRYTLDWKGSNWISYGPWLKEPRDPKFFRGDRVLTREILGNQLIVHVIEEPFVADRSVYIGLPRGKDYSTRYAGALLASRLMTFYFRVFYNEFAELFPKIRVVQFKELPIRRISFTTPAAQRAALVAEAQALYEGGPRRGVETPAPRPAAGRPPTRSEAGAPAGGRPAAGALEATSVAKAGGDPATGAAGWRGWREGWAGLWAWADARLPQGADGAPDTANEQSDAVHDLLAHLAERMIALHKQKQAGAAAFTGWLEGETGSAIEDWTLKTVVNSFWEQPWEEIERAVQKNRGKLAQTQGLRGKAADAALTPLLRVARGRWAAASADLAPTLAAIIATDRLIDLIVYRLYGLTDAEIDLVEGG